MEGWVREAEAHALDKDFGDDVTVMQGSIRSTSVWR